MSHWISAIIGTLLGVLTLCDPPRPIAGASRFGLGGCRRCAGCNWHLPKSVDTVAVYLGKVTRLHWLLWLHLP